MVKQQNRHVTGGRKAYKGEMQWHAGIYTKNTSPYMQICGGSLVSSNVVISGNVWLVITGVPVWSTFLLIKFQTPQTLRSASVYNYCYLYIYKLKK